MVKRRFVLTSFLFWVIMVFSIILAERIDFLAGVFMTPMPTETFFAFAILTFLCFVIYFYFEIRNNKTKPNYLLLSLMVLLFVSGTVGIWHTSGTPFLLDGVLRYPYVFPLEKTIYTITLAFGLTTSYAFFEVFPRNQFDAKRIKWFYYSVAVVGLISIIYSLATEYPLYGQIFQIAETSSTRVSILSFYNNENTYGAMLMLSFFAIAIVNYTRHAWWNYVIMLGFAVAMIFSSSLTCIAVTVLFTIVYFILMTVKLAKDGKKGQIIFHSLFIPLLSIAAVITFGVMYAFEVKPIVSVIDFIIQIIFKKDFKTISNRIPNWSNALSVLNSPIDWIFGKGYKTFDSAISYRYALIYGHGNTFVDSGLIAIVGSFGAIGALIYLFFIIFTIYMFAKINKAKKGAKAVIPFVGFFFMLIHGIFENTIFLSFDTKGVVISMMFIMPILIEYNNVKRVELTEYVKTVDIPVKRYFHSKNFANLLASISISLSVAMLSSSFMLIKSFDTMKDLFTIFAVTSLMLLAFFLTFPFVLRVWAVKMHRKLFIGTVILNIVTLIGISTLVGLTFGLLTHKLTVGVFLFAASFIVILLIQVLIYSVRYGYMKEWTYYFKDMVESTIVNSLLSLVFFGAIAFLVSRAIDFSIMFFIAANLIFFISYLCLLTLLPNHPSNTRKWKELLYFYNDVYLKRIQNTLLKEEQK